MDILLWVILSYICILVILVLLYPIRDSVFKYFSIVSIVITIGIPIIVFISYIDKSSADGGGMVFAMSIVLSPIVLIMGALIGAVIQVFYSFIMSKSMFGKITKFVILYESSNRFVVIFNKIKKDSNGKREISHKIVIDSMIDETCNIEHSIYDEANAKRDWEVIEEYKNINIKEFIKTHRSKLDWNLAYIFRFLNFAKAKIPISNEGKTYILNYGNAKQYINTIGARAYNTIDAIQKARRDDILAVFKNLAIFLSIPFIAFTCFWLGYVYFANSKYSPCSIYYAAKSNDEVKLKKLLDSGLNPNLQCQASYVKKLFGDILLLNTVDANNTPLNEAIKNNNENILKLLLDSGARVVYNGVDFTYTAIQKGNINIIKLMINNVTNTNKDFNQYLVNALHNRTQNSLEIVRLMLDSGADVNYTYGNASYKPRVLYAAIRYAQSSDIVKLLISKGAKVDDEDYPAMAFEYLDRCQAIEMILKHYKLSEEQRIDILKNAIFKEVLIDAESRDINYEDILILAIESAKPSKKWIEEQFGKNFSLRGEPKLSTMIVLLKYGANINMIYEKSGNNLLLELMQECDDMLDCYNRIVFLIENGIDLSHKNKDSKNALDIFNEKSKNDSKDRNKIDSLRKLIESNMPKE